jgi:molybdate transport system substrate-binding protein
MSALALAALAGAAGCWGSPSASHGTVVVDAASSLAGAFGTLARRFEATHPGWRVTVNLGGSDSLAAAIGQGAPADVFAAASPATMATVQRAGQTAAPPTVFAANRVELAVPLDNPAHIATLADTTRPGVKLALCAATVPCGAVARQTYAAEHLTPHPVTDELDVTAVLTKVASGEADAGVVYQTDVLGSPQVRAIPLGPAAALTQYLIAPVRTGRHLALARAFIDLVVSAQGRRVLRHGGFIDVRVAG